MIGHLTLFWMVMMPGITYEKARKFAQEQVAEIESEDDKEVTVK